MKTTSPTWHFPLWGHWPFRRRERTQSQAAERPAGRRPWGVFVLVAAIALIVGAGAMFFVMRAPSPAMPAHTPVQGAAPPAAHGQMVMPPAGPEPAAPSSKAVRISPERQQLIGVRTAVVEPRRSASTLRTVGVLAYDETRTTEIHTKIAGWVDKLYVDYVGKNVRKGEPLFTIYSPELVSTQVEYLIAHKAQAQATDASSSRQKINDSLVSATRKRLRLWDISDKQIEELERTQEPVKTMTLYSPFDGVVLERKTFPGQYVTPEMATFRIGDLSTIWVFGQVFEYELGRVKVGQTAEIEFPYGQTTRRLQGRIGFIYPDIDPRTRTAKVRIEFKNPGLALKPETYVTVVIRTAAAAEVLSVPKEAVIDDGVKQYVLLALPDGYFEPREIKVGPAQDELYPVVSGLAAGDRVVTSAQFLIDSETNLQAAMKSMSMSMPGMKMDEGKDDMKDMPGMEKR